MSRISRFLYYNWIKTSWISKFLEKKNLLNFGVSYVDNFNSFHRRNIELKKLDHNKSKLSIHSEKIGFLEFDKRLKDRELIWLNKIESTIKSRTNGSN